MEIAYHIGANCTDEERLLKSILKNAQTLLEHGVAVPGPGKYRRLLRETIQGLDGRAPRSGTRDILIDAIVEEDDIDRVVLSNDNFIAIPKRAFDHQTFYPQTTQKVGTMARLFPDDDLSFHIGLRHPASFLQEMAKRIETPRLGDLLGGMSPLDLRWTDVIARMRQAAPHAEIIVWCNEDTPLIWEDLMRLQTGLPWDVPLTGRFDVLGRIVTKEGMTNLQERLKQEKPATPAAQHEIIAQIIESHGKPEAMQDEITYPELTPEVVAAMTENYDADVIALRDMEGVRMVLPFTTSG